MGLELPGRVVVVNDRRPFAPAEGGRTKAVATRGREPDRTCTTRFFFCSQPFARGLARGANAHLVPRKAT